MYQLLPPVPPIPPPPHWHDSRQGILSLHPDKGSNAFQAPAGKKNAHFFSLQKYVHLLMF